jgi:hypothetical protein
MKTLSLWVAAPLAFLAATEARAQDVERYHVFERSLSSANSYANKFTDVTLTAAVTPPSGATRTVRGFYDGDGAGGQSGNVWKFRYMPLETGPHSYRTTSNDAQLDGVTGSFNGVASASSNLFLRRGPLRIHPANPHAVAHHDGTPFFWNGESEHFFLTHDATKISQSERLAALDFLQTKKVNNLLMTMVNADSFWTFPWAGTTSSDLDRNRFDLARLRQWEQVFTVARDREIACDLWFFSDDSGSLYPAAGGAQEDLYFRTMIARFAAFANVTWNLALEYGEYRTASWVTSRASFFKAENPYGGFLGVHDTPDDTWDFPGNADLDHSSLQNFTSWDPLNAVVINNRASTAAAGRPIPIFHEEFGYEGSINGALDTLRRNAWAITCGGGFYKSGTLGFWIGTPYGQAGHFDHTRILYETVTRTRWWEMQPRNNLVSSGGTGRYCLGKVAGASSEFLVFSVSGSSFTLDLTGISSTLALEWVNPLTGATSAGSVAGGAVRTLTNPFGSGEAAVRVGGGIVDTTPPSPPASLQAAALGPTRIDLSWGAANDPESGIAGYRIHRDTVPGVTTADFIAPAVSAATYADTAVQPGTIYFYRVSAVNGAGLEGPLSNEATAATPAGNSPPAGNNASLTVPEDGSVGFTLTATDPDGDPVNRFRIVAAPSKGAVQSFDPATGSGIYRPNADQNGPDTFTFDASDDAGATYGADGTISITITPVNDAPVAQNRSATTPPATAVGIQLVYADPDGPGPFTITIVAAPANGTLTGSSNDRTYTPNPGFTGTEIFTWKVNDGLADSNVATVTITVGGGGMGVIANIGAQSGLAYVADVLDVGKLQYIDRTFAFSAVPPSCVGLEYIRTANDDKGSTGSAFLSFDVSQDVTVYVGHDDRFAAKPPWMASYTDTGDDIVSGGGTFSLWARDYAAGTVTLGGNTSDGVAQNSMYTLVVRPRTGPPPADTDGDGMTDAQEAAAGFDPADPDQDANGVLDGQDDWDLDGTINRNDPTPGSVPGPFVGGSGSGGGCGATGFEAILLLLLRPRRHAPSPRRG